jgi:endoglucanase
MLRNLIPIIICVWCSEVPGAATAPARPFPQNLAYPYGVKPATIPDTLMKSEYERWKSVVLVECGSGLYRINCTNEYDGETRVEGIGFGMLITAYYGEKDKFDGLYAFYKKFCNSTAKGMMAWQTTCSSAKDQGSATDGDIDVAFALLVAGWQWGGTYESEAKKVIEVLKTSVIKSCSNDVLALAGGVSGGSAWGGCDCTDLSYYNPAFFRVFAKVTGDSTWNKLAESTYAILNNGMNASTGLVPDWQTVSGTAGCSGRTNYFRYDACRAPYRIALDYLWNGNEKAKAWCVKVSNWANGVGAANIKDGYNLNGSANGSNHTSSFVGSFAVAAMCNSQAITDAFAADCSKLRDKLWFNICTRMLYLLAMTGNLWKNDMVEVQPGHKPPAGQEIMVKVHRHGLEISGAGKVRSVDIHDASGRLVASFHPPAASGRRVDISFLRNGFYCATIACENGIHMKRLNSPIFFHGIYY